MPRYAAFLRGISPVVSKMSDLKEAFEAASFEDVRTVLASGNVVFTTRKTSTETLAHKCEAAMQKHLGKTFFTIVRSFDEIEAILASDPYRTPGAKLPANAKRMVTFLREPPKKRTSLPIEVPGARILRRKGCEVFSVHIPSSRGPVFMTLLEKTYGKDITTRTWDTVLKVAKAAT